MSSETFHVKLVSEAAEYVSISQVMQRDYPLQELIGAMLPVVGRDSARIQQLLRIGGFSNGEYKFRWEGREVSAAEIELVLEHFPRPEPNRRFDPEACFMIRFIRDVEVLALPKQAAEKKGLFSGESFWDQMLKLAAGNLHYTDYSFADRADVYSLQLGVELEEKFRAILPLIKPKSAGERIERLRPQTIEFLARR
jgi:hypothetical protein